MVCVFCKQKTAYEMRISDWSSDVCSSDLTGAAAPRSEGGRQDVRPEKKVIALVDVEALNRGRVEGDETCEVAGVGPVAVSAVRRLQIGRASCRERVCQYV